MFSADEVRDGLVGAVAALRWQAQDVMDTLVLPTWTTEKHGYDRLLYGVVMNVMSLADRLSVYRSGTDRDQTKRLRRLFVEMGATPETAGVAVQLWRHTLMHTGLPVTIRDEVSDIRYQWLLHWGPPHLAAEQHMTLSPGGEDWRVLNFGALTAVDDLGTACADYFASVDGDPLRERAVVEAHALLNSLQVVKLR
jgi:hypothetical protein